MFLHRPSTQRGLAEHGWLRSRHSFSFADYYDPAYMGFRALRVINEDWVAPGAGFPTHRHRDMDILSYVIDGALEHRDSLGNGSVIRPGDVQRMRAGSGVEHSEYNASQTEPVRFLQIWILPGERGGAPGYAQRHVPAAERQGRLRLVASPDGRDESVTIDRDVCVFSTLLAAGEGLAHAVGAGRHGWAQIITGNVRLNGLALGPGDGAAWSEEPRVELAADTDAHLLVFDLP